MYKIIIIIFFSNYFNMPSFQSKEYW